MSTQNPVTNTHSALSITEAPAPTILFKIANPIIHMLLNSPLHGLVDKHLLLLSWHGRKSGRAYTIPVGYKQDGTHITLFTFSRWQANFKEPHPVRIKLKGTWYSGSGVIDTDTRKAGEFIKQSVADSGQSGYRRFRMQIEGEREPTVEELMPEVEKRNMVLIHVTID